MGAETGRRATLLSFVAVLLGMLVLTFRMVRPYLLAVLMGGILALLARPFYLLLRRKGLAPKLASLVVTLSIVLIVIGPVGFFVTRVVRQSISVGQSLANSPGVSLEGLIDRLSHWRLVQAFVHDPAALDRQIRSALQGLGKAASAATVAAVANLPKILLQLVLALIACFFLLIDGSGFVRWSAEKIPLDWSVRARILESFRNTSISVIWATLAAAGAQACVMLAGYLLLGVPGAFLAAGAIFILAWIPLIGSTPVWVVGAIYLYLQGSLARALAMVGFGLITGVVDNFVRPWVLRGRGQMHPLVSLVAIFGGIQMFGIVGVFVGPILAAVTIALLQIWPTVASRFGVLPSAPEAPRRESA